jgi:hypothetical protein
MLEFQINISWGKEDLTQKCGLMITSEAPKELNDKTHL